MHRVELGTARQRRNGLTRIQNFQRIETLANRVELLTLGFAELHAHLSQLFDADPVLAGNRAAMMNTKLQNLAAELLRFFELAFIVAILEDKRMQAAIACMEHVRHR